MENAKDPFEELMHQINDLLQIVADNADKPLSEKPPKDVDVKLARLERQVQLFQKKARANIGQMGISDEEIKASIAKIRANEHSAYKKIIDRSESLKKVIEKKKALLNDLKSVNEEALTEDISISENKNLSKKSSTTRKNLFKRVGGNKNWRPL